eukprot:358677-Chlamydomonas_euryale.AAC.3
MGHAPRHRNRASSYKTEQKRKKYFILQRRTNVELCRTQRIIAESGPQSARAQPALTASSATWLEAAGRDRCGARDARGPPRLRAADNRLRQSPTIALHF